MLGGLPSPRRILQALGATAILTATTRAQCDRVEVRRNFADLSSADQRRFLAAMNAMARDGVIGDLQRTHYRMFSTAHGNEYFLIAHRWLIHQAAQRLAEYGFPFLPCLNSCASYDTMFVNDEVLAPLGGLRGCINGQIDSFDSFYVVDNNDGRQLNCTSREGNGAAVCSCAIIQQTISEEDNFVSLSRRLENTCHAIVHNNVGGSMWSLTTSAADPMFFMHHCDVDKWLATWQAIEPTRVAAMGEQFLKASSGEWAEYTVEQLLNHEENLCYTYPELQRESTQADEEQEEEPDTQEEEEEEDSQERTDQGEGESEEGSNQEDEDDGQAEGETDEDNSSNDAQEGEDSEAEGEEADEDQEDSSTPTGASRNTTSTPRSSPPSIAIPESQLQPGSAVETLPELSDDFVRGFNLNPDEVKKSREELSDIMKRVRELVDSGKFRSLVDTLKRRIGVGKDGKGDGEEDEDGDVKDPTVKGSAVRATTMVGRCVAVGLVLASMLL